MYDRVSVGRRTNREVSFSFFFFPSTPVPILILRMSRPLSIPIRPERIEHLEMLVRGAEVRSRRERRHFVALDADVVAEAFGGVVGVFVCEWVV
jgi:hypothetical protein